MTLLTLWSRPERKVSIVTGAGAENLPEGRRVRVPQGVGEVVDGAADPVVVRVGGYDLAVPRAHVELLEKSPD